ncbi:MAG: hypothetical protein II337_08930, partial [Clostridia bacterium]|nr:hypothetical protein [Clostridia bacterium]
NVTEYFHKLLHTELRSFKTYSFSLLYHQYLNNSTVSEKQLGKTAAFEPKTHSPQYVEKRGSEKNNQKKQKNSRQTLDK